MDEILLTPEEIRQAIDYALIEKRAPEVTAEFLYRAVARAQVRKVYEYMRTHWVSARQLDYKTARDNTVQLTIKSEDWQALREAAGEGK